MAISIYDRTEWWRYIHRYLCFVRADDRHSVHGKRVYSWSPRRKQHCKSIRTHGSGKGMDGNRLPRCVHIIPYLRILLHSIRMVSQLYRSIIDRKSQRNSRLIRPVFQGFLHQSRHSNHLGNNLSGRHSLDYHPRSAPWHRESIKTSHAIIIHIAPRHRSGSMPIA